MVSKNTSKNSKRTPAKTPLMTEPFAPRVQTQKFLKLSIDNGTVCINWPWTLRFEEPHEDERKNSLDPFGIFDLKRWERERGAETQPHKTHKRSTSPTMTSTWKTMRITRLGLASRRCRICQWQNPASLRAPPASHTAGLKFVGFCHRVGANNTCSLRLFQICGLVLFTIFEEK